MFTNTQLFKNGKGKVREGGGKGWVLNLTLCLRMDILWGMGNPMSELTLTFIDSFNSRKRTQNLGPVKQGCLHQYYVTVGWGLEPI